MTLANTVLQLTGTGVSALATLRLVGPAVIPFLSRRFSRTVAPGAIVHGQMRDDVGVIDDPVVCLAEDSSHADVTLHGGTWVVRSFIELALRDGFSRLVPSASTLAFVEARNLLEAELRLALPLARTRRAATLLLGQPRAWARWLASVPDAMSIAQVSQDRSLWHLLHPPRIAIVGVPNAGKSTLANRLFGTDRSIVSPLAGTTRDWVGEEANLDGLIVHLLDTPGRRETDDPIERRAIAQSDRPIGEADLVLLVIDSTNDDPHQASLLSAYPDALVLFNKSDLGGRARRFAHARDSLAVSALHSSGIDSLVTTIHNRLGIRSGTPDAPCAFTARQLELLERGQNDLAALRDVFASPLSSPSPE